MAIAGTCERVTEIYRVDEKGYYRSSSRSIWRKYPGTAGYLHRIIYQSEVGPIPPGHVVHHRDGNQENNVPENLEAMPVAEHMALHWAERSGREGTCVACGKRYVFRATRAFYCSRRCLERLRSRRRRARKG